MADRTTRIHEVTEMYLQIVQQLNQHTVPEWLKLDLTFQQMKVLYILKQKGPLKMSVLSRELHVSMPTITGIISRLAERGDSPALVARVSSVEDRRQVWAHLTGAGREVTEHLDSLNTRLLGNALAQLTDGEMEDSRAGLRHILQALSEQRPTTTVTTSLEDVAANLTLVIGEDVESPVAIKEPVLS